MRLPTDEKSFGEEGAAKRGVRGAESGADGEFAFAADAAGEDQIGDVGAGDDEDQCRGGEKDEQDSAGAGTDLFVRGAWRRNGEPALAG